MHSRMIVFAVIAGTLLSAGCGGTIEQGEEDVAGVEEFDLGKSFAPVADATVEAASPAKNFGATATLLSDGSPLKRCYLKFNVANLSGPVTRAQLRLYASDPSANGPAVWRTSTSWTEAGITWSNKPGTLGATPLANLGKVDINTWVTIDVTPAITGNGTFAFVLFQSTSETDGVDFDSRTGLRPPQLVVETGDTFAPSVSITSPASNTTYGSAQTVTLTAAASDDTGVTKVEFFKDGVLMGSDATVPYQWSWAVPGGVNSTYSWTAKAWDASGNSTLSQPVSLTVATTTSAATFTLVVLPDTQFMTSKPNAEWQTAFYTTTRWISSNAAARNIVMVASVGDIQDYASNPAFFPRASQAMSYLEAPNAPGLPVPYSIALGNHDMDCYGTHNCDATPETHRTASYFNTHFPVSRFAAMPTYGGNHVVGGVNYFNQYHRFSAAGTQWLLISLRNFVKSEDRAWALSVIDAPEHAGHHVIISVHDYMDGSGARTTAGTALWNEVVGRRANIRFVLCGHLNGGARRADTGAGGNVVHQLLSDYQTATTLAPNTFIRLMTFNPGADTVDVKTYSPYLNQYQTGEDQFVLNVPM